MVIAFYLAGMIWTAWSCRAAPRKCYALYPALWSSLIDLSAAVLVALWPVLLIVAVCEVMKGRRGV